MAIISVDHFKWEQKVIKALDEAPNSKIERVRSIRDILVDVKQSSGKRTIVYILKCLYHDDMKKLRVDLARLNLIRTKVNPPVVDEFDVLSTIWPSVLKLCMVDEEFFIMMKAIGQDTQLIYKDPRL